eukprot:COSAG04_NODE_10635_length_762_cov_1.282051_1_plen_77_part_10
MCGPAWLQLGRGVSSYEISPVCTHVMLLRTQDSARLQNVAVSHTGSLQELYPCINTRLARRPAGGRRVGLHPVVCAV